MYFAQPSFCVFEWCGPYVQLRTGIFATHSLTYSIVRTIKGHPQIPRFITIMKPTIKHNLYSFSAIEKSKSRVTDHSGFCYYCPTQTKCKILIFIEVSVYFPWRIEKRKDPFYMISYAWNPCRMLGLPRYFVWVEKPLCYTIGRSFTNLHQELIKQYSICMILLSLSLQTTHKSNIWEPLVPIKGTINNACLTLNMAHKLFGQKREKKSFWKVSLEEKKV